MLHALATIALCIFIGERVWHYWSAIQDARRFRRGMQLLYPRSPPPKPPPALRLAAPALKPRRTPPWERLELQHRFLLGCALTFVIVGITAAVGF